MLYSFYFCLDTFMVFILTPVLYIMKLSSTTAFWGILRVNISIVTKKMREHYGVQDRHYNKNEQGQGKQELMKSEVQIVLMLQYLLQW